MKYSVYYLNSFHEHDITDLQIAKVPIYSNKPNGYKLEFFNIKSDEWELCELVGVSNGGMKCQILMNENKC